MRAIGHFLGRAEIARASSPASRLATPPTVLIPPAAGIAVGTVGLAATVLTSVAAFRSLWLPIWLVAAVTGACLGALSLTGPSDSAIQSRHVIAVFRMYSRLLPSLFAGAVLTAVLWHTGLTRAVPGVWLLLYGCALIQASSVASGGMALLGSLFALLALVAFCAPQSGQLPILGIGFGELHILYGVVTLRAVAALRH
jgi:hypothetical protein